MKKTNKLRRRQLLTTVSALALAGSVYAFGNASAGEADRVPLWVTFGWHYEQMDGLGDVFHPAFADATMAAGFASALPLEKAIAAGYGGESEITYRPNSSDWLFSVGVRYGRSFGHKDYHAQTAPASAEWIFSAPTLGIHGSQHIPPWGAKFADYSATNKEAHTIIDFQAGKDIGLGVISDSDMKFGVRYAQFQSRSKAHLSADPDFHFSPYVSNITGWFGHLHESGATQSFHVFRGSADFSRSYRGLGPMVSWDASMAMAGNPKDGELAIDLGASAAMLFGRQKTSVQHDEHDKFIDYGHYNGVNIYDRTASPPPRSRIVTVPNIGGFAGISYRFEDAKLSIGYRADLFFNAIDGGVDTRKEINRGFFGPYASISIGIGD